MRQRSFQYRGFTILVDSRITQAWSLVSGHQKAGMMQSVIAAYSRWRRELESAKFYPTREAIGASLTYGIQPSDTFSDITKKVSNKRVKDEVLRLLRFSYFRPLAQNPIHNLFCRAVWQAANDSDERFFRKLGRILEREPVLCPAVAEPTPVEAALVDEWIVKDGLCLCWLSDPAIAELFGKTGYYHCNFEAVRKARQRLHLRKPKLRPATSVRLQGTEIILS